MLLEHSNCLDGGFRADSKQLHGAIRRAALSVEVSVPFRMLKLQREVEQNAPNFNITPQGETRTQISIQILWNASFQFQLWKRTHFKAVLNNNNIYKKQQPKKKSKKNQPHKCAISYFNSGGMQLPSQLPRLWIGAVSSELAVSPLTGVRGRALCCLLSFLLGADCSSGPWRGHRAPSFPLPKQEGDLEAELMHLARLPCCWQSSRWAFLPLFLLGGGDRTTSLCILTPSRL